MIHPTFTDVMDSEREMLVRFCARYTGDVHVAEDLAQQTLLQAWRNAHQLNDPQARTGWLFSIARNQCRMWARDRRRELTHIVAPERMDVQAMLHDRIANHDLEQELERHDLARLVERALRLLPPDVRDVLLRRYVEDVPQAELAARLGVTQGAVEARLQRGKRALREVLTSELGDETAAYGFIAPSDAGWKETPIWCPGCGQRHLEGRFNSAAGKLYMRCTACARSEAHFIHSHLGTALKDVKTYRPAVGRVLDNIHALFRVRGGGGLGSCPRCGMLLPLQRGLPHWVPSQFADPESIHIWCGACGVGDSETWHSLTWSLPAARAFWQAHPRMRFSPGREIEFAALLW